MVVSEAIKLVKTEARMGLAHALSDGDPHNPRAINQLFKALNTIRVAMRGKATIDRDLALALIMLNDQIQGNYYRTLVKDLRIGPMLEKDDLYTLNELVHGIFEDPF